MKFQFIVVFNFAILDTLNCDFACDANTHFIPLSKILLNVLTC